MVWTLLAMNRAKRRRISLNVTRHRAHHRVPNRLTQQPLHRVRRTIPGLLRQRPTPTGVHTGQQPEQKRPRLPTRRHPAEPARDRREPGVELRQPLSYAVPSGRRTIFICPRTTHDQPVAVSTPADTPTSPNRDVLIAGHLHNDPGLSY
jgi:hypothetical protein